MTEVYNKQLKSLETLLQKKRQQPNASEKTTAYNVISGLKLPPANSTRLAAYHSHHPTSILQSKPTPNDAKQSPNVSMPEPSHVLANTMDTSSLKPAKNFPIKVPEKARKQERIERSERIERIERSESRGRGKRIVNQRLREEGMKQ